MALKPVPGAGLHSVAVVGAGAAGLAAARWLQQHGVAVTLFDKGRKVGGRLALRETPHGHFDHGASHVFAHQPALQSALAALCQTGHAAPWLALRDAEGLAAVVGTPAMHTLAQCWARGLDLRCAQSVQSITPQQGAWQLRVQGDDHLHRFDAVIVTVPYPQLPALLPDCSLPAALASIRYNPCWTLLWTPAAAALPAQSHWQLDAHHSIERISREDLKPGRSGPPRYVVHATAAWSTTHLEQPAEVIAPWLQAEAVQWLGISASSHYAAAHRWRYGRVRQALGVSQIEMAPGLHYASDGCLGDGIECATLSGLAAAQALLETLE